VTAYVIAARRSPVMPAGGAFARLSLHDLGAPILAACLADAGLSPDRVDEVICANALGAGGNPARVLALAAGLPERVAGLTIDRQCAGGLDAIRLAAAMVSAGHADLVLAGGVESASRRPVRLRTDPDGGPPVSYDAPPFTPWPDRDPAMHSAAAALADRLGISRAEQDAFAIASHAKARAAQHCEVLPLLGHARDGFTRDLTPGLAARAKVVEGTITAANAAISGDAAAFVLVASPRLARLAPRALRIVDSATVGSAPEDPALAPLAAIARIAPRGADLAAVELMEAYAVQAIATIRAAGFDPGVVNRKGGALARGHPIGASGAILAARLFHDIDTGRGLAAIAAAGGIGTALLLEA
jgi:acetyl-CoA C-acetyltransferase